MIELVFYFIAIFLILMGISSLWWVIKYYKTGIREVPLPPWFDEESESLENRGLFDGAVSLIAGIILLFFLLITQFDFSMLINLLLSLLITSLVPISIIVFFKRRGVTKEDIKKIYEL